MSIDTGYYFLVDYNEEYLHLSLGLNAATLNGDMSAFWLRLSVFDTLAHHALGTKPQAVFDGLNPLVKQLFRKILDEGEAALGKPYESELGSVTLTAFASRDVPVVVLIASARPKDIDILRAKQAPSVSDAGSPSTVDVQSEQKPSNWQRFFGLAFQTFGAGATAYSNSYGGQLPRKSGQTCYTDFLGNSAYTKCY